MKEGIVVAYKPQNNVHGNQQLRHDPRSGGRQFGEMDIGCGCDAYEMHTDEWLGMEKTMDYDCFPDYFRLDLPPVLRLSELHQNN